MLNQIVVDMGNQLLEAKGQVAQSIADEKRLAKQVEQETSLPACEIELPLHMVLDDLCTLFNLKNVFRRKVLGGESEAVLQRYRAQRVPKPTKQPRSSKKSLSAKRQLR